MDMQHFITGNFRYVFSSAINIGVLNGIYRYATIDQYKFKDFLNSLGNSFVVIFVSGYLILFLKEKKEDIK